MIERSANGIALLKRRSLAVAEALQVAIQTVDMKTAPFGLVEQLAEAAQGLARIQAISAASRPAIEQAESALEALRDWLAGETR